MWLDYVLASQNLFDYVSKFKVHDPNILSDHCLITFSLEFGNEEITDSLSENYDYVDGNFVWKAEFKDEYVSRLNDEVTIEQLNSLNANISSCDENGINTCLEEFVSIFDTVCAPIFKKMRQRDCANASSNITFSNKKENPWYTDECHEKKHCFLYLLDTIRYDTLLMQKAITDHEHIYKYNRIQDSKLHTEEYHLRKIHVMECL